MEMADWLPSSQWRCGGGKPGLLKVETHKVQACQDNEVTADEEQSDDEEQEIRTRSGTARKSYFLVVDSKPRPLGNHTSDPLGTCKTCATRHSRGGVLLGPVKHPVQIDNAGARSVALGQSLPEVARVGYQFGRPNP